MFKSLRGEPFSDLWGTHRLFVVEKFTILRNVHEHSAEIVKSTRYNIGIWLNVCSLQPLS